MGRQLDKLQIFIIKFIHGIGNKRKHKSEESKEICLPFSTHDRVHYLVQRSINRYNYLCVLSLKIRCLYRQRYCNSAYLLLLSIALVVRAAKQTDIITLMDGHLFSPVVKLSSGTVPHKYIFALDHKSCPLSWFHRRRKHFTNNKPDALSYPK